jgi:spoIIIJ-associated protein
VEWVEIKGKTIEVAVEAAMRELGVEDRDRLAIEVIQQPERGFLGLGGRDAIIRARLKPPRRRRGGKRRVGPTGDQARSSQAKPMQERPRRGQMSAKEERRPSRERRSREHAPEPRRPGPGGARQGRGGPPREAADPDQLAPRVKEFLTGLVEAFGLEGEVDVRVEEDVIVANVTGEQTEALVGPRGSVLEAIHELARTILHEPGLETPRVRLDIAGYAERRRKALTIYADQLIDQVLAEGGEIMLEPMSAADRKVIHDAAAARPGLRSYSEGVAPRRYVVLARMDESSAEPPVEEDEEEELPE